VNGHDDIDWREIIGRGVESEELDYKAAQHWGKLGRVGKAKFVRHCMALANTKGGYIVIGVGEDQTGRPAHFTGLTDAEVRSFDPTDVGNVLNAYADPAIEFDLVRPTVDGRAYVVFVVHRFRDLPHVCTRSCEHELQQGAFYIRTQDAASRVAYRASELHGIVQRALRNQREYLGRMLRGILYETKEGIEPAAESRFLEQYKRSRGFATRLRDAQGGPAFEVLAYPTDYEEQRFSLTELRIVITEASYNFRDLPFAPFGTDAETYFTNVSLRSFLQNEALCWQAFQSGLFHHYSQLPGPAGELSYHELTRVVPEAVFFLAQFYEGLGLNSELLTLQVELEQVQNARLTQAEPLGRDPFLCRIPDIRVSLKRSAADLASGVVAHSVRIVREICERFNVPAGKHRSLENDIAEYLDRLP